MIFEELGTPGLSWSKKSCYLKVLSQLCSNFCHHITIHTHTISSNLIRLNHTAHHFRKFQVFGKPGKPGSFQFRYGKFSKTYVFGFNPNFGILSLSFESSQITLYNISKTTEFLETDLAVHLCTLYQTQKEMYHCCVPLKQLCKCCQEYYQLCGLYIT